MSTTLFKLITYAILIELNKHNIGFKDELFNINTLFFADDGLCLAQSVEEARLRITQLSRIVGEYGLEINAIKSNIVIYNMKNKPDQIGGIRVKRSFEYLGITVCDKKDCFALHKEVMSTKANNLTNQTTSVVAKCCNRLLIGKTFWKSVALPSILYGTDVVHFNKTNINTLQTIENKVYRLILRAPRYTPLCVLRGEIGATAMETRLMKTKMTFLRYLLNKEDSLVGRVFQEMRSNFKEDAWTEQIIDITEKTGLSKYNIKNLSKDKIKQVVQKLDTMKWREELNTKSSVVLYKMNKSEPKEEQFYDNRPSSVTFFRCRSNTLALNDRKRFNNGETKCDLCSDTMENLEHFLLYCPSYQNIRTKSKLFVQPYIENKLSELLFIDTANREKIKQTIQDMWNKRDKLMKETQ